MHHADQEIISLLQNESTREKGFDLLVKAYQQEIYWLIRRMVIDHDDSDDLTYEQISEITGTSVGALKATYHLAVKKIQKKLFPE